MASRLSQIAGSGRATDVVSTLLVLNLLVALIGGGAAVTLFGARVPTFTTRLSLALIFIWFGGRSALRHRDWFRPAVMTEAGRRYLPEICVAVLFVIGLTIRLWGIGYGGPLVVHPDEQQGAGVAVTMLKSGWIKPPVPYHYPTVYHYALLPAFGLKYARGKAAGLWTTLNDVDGRSFEFYRLGRAHSAVFGALTILLTYALATKLWPGSRGRWVGVMAATFVTFSFNHVRESHNAVTDAALIFFMVVALIAIVRAFRLGTARAYAIAGFACGIACATKYSAVPLVAVLVAAHFLDGSRAWSEWRRLPVGLVAVPVGFFTGYPYALLNWPPFLEHLGRMGAYAGTREFDPAARFNHIAGYAAESGFGLLFTVVLGIALIYYIHRKRAEELLAVTLIFVTMVLLSRTAHPFYARYLLPILPAGAIIVGSFLMEAGGWLSRARVSAKVVQACLAGTVVLLVWPQAHESMQFVKYVSLPDTRAQAYEFIVQRFERGATIASEEQYLRLPRGYRLIRWSPLHQQGVDEFAKRHVDALVFSDDLEPAEADIASVRARSDLKNTFPLLAVFPAKDGVTAGPTVSIRLGRRER
jgi:4-amino-4-deoxy-L-arabinose transferase-like glycosyltransferase